jgi:hypothetical protein
VNCRTRKSAECHQGRPECDQLGLVEPGGLVTHAEPERQQQQKGDQCGDELGDDHEHARNDCGDSDQQLVDGPHPHSCIGEKHLQVCARNVLEQLDDGRPGGEGKVGDVLAGLFEVCCVLELHVDEDLPVVRELDGPPAEAEQGLHLLLADALATPVEHDLLEVVEVGFEADLQQRLLDEGPMPRSLS